MASSAAPGLLTGLQHLCTTTQQSRPLFSALGTRENLLDPALSLVRATLNVASTIGSNEAEHFTSHCLRVGTCTALNKLGLRKEQIELWLGWTSRDMFAHYVR